VLRSPSDHSAGGAVGVGVAVGAAGVVSLGVGVADSVCSGLGSLLGAASAGVVVGPDPCPAEDAGLEASA
jgi:hypothetical protein